MFFVQWPHNHTSHLHLNWFLGNNTFNVLFCQAQKLSREMRAVWRSHVKKHVTISTSFLSLFKSEGVNSSICCVVLIAAAKRRLILFVPLHKDDNHLKVRLDYCDSLASGCPQNPMRSLQLIQNAAARDLTEVDNRDYLTPAGFSSLTAHEIKNSFENPLPDFQGPLRSSSILSGVAKSTIPD